MTRYPLHPSAERVANDLSNAADPVKLFVIQGGRFSFSAGSHFARLFGVSASCRAGEAQAVSAWIRIVKRKAGAA